MTPPVGASEYKMEEVPSEKPRIEVKSLLDLQTPPEDDPQELIKYRFLCKGGGLVLVGQTGVGKSSLAMQLAIELSLGKRVFGLVPARPLKVLIVQAENDEGDMAEMRDGVMKGLCLSEESRSQVNISVACVDDQAGMGFITALDKLLEVGIYDLVIIDPLFAYCGCDVSKQGEISAFLRNGLNPVLHKYSVGCILLHHTNKPPSSKDAPKYGPYELAYLGSGSAELANWMRAGIYLRPTDTRGTFELCLTKRGSRVGWKDVNGERVYSSHIRHTRKDGMIFWEQVTKEEEGMLQATKGGGKPEPTIDHLLGIFPDTLDRNNPEGSLFTSDRIKQAFKDRGWSKNSYKGLCDQAIAEGKLVKERGPRNNQQLHAKPEVWKAYQRSIHDKGTILEAQPALPRVPVGVVESSGVVRGRDWTAVGVVSRPAYFLNRPTTDWTTELARRLIGLIYFHALSPGHSEGGGRAAWPEILCEGKDSFNRANPGLLAPIPSGGLPQSPAPVSY